MFDVTSRSGVCIITINSDLDIANAQALESALALAESASERPIIVSLSECPYCDSSALAVFVQAKRRLGAHFALIVPPQSKCRRVFDITALTEYLSVFASVEDALGDSPSSRRG